MSSGFFGPEFFKKNRAKLKTLFRGSAPMVITANGLLQKSADTAYPFRQDSNFWYLTGTDEPDLILVMDKDKEYLIVPQREQSRVTFDGGLDKAGISKASGITEILDEKDGWKRLGGRLERVKHAATLAPLSRYLESHGLYTNPARARLIEKIHSHNEKIKLIDLRPKLSNLRMIKQAPEQDAIKKAVDETAKALKSVKRSGLSKFKYEYEIAAKLTAAFLHVGYEHAYQPIIASGKNACTLHYTANNSELKPKDLLLIDVGAEVNHYASDITRTYAVSPPTKRQRAIYEEVCAIQDYAMSLLKPGVRLKDYEKQVEHLAGEKLRELGLIKTINKEQVRRFYPHATSHFLGLDVHDSADYKRPLEAGMVLTVEPGIYVRAEGIGVRIEDDVLITDRGTEILSNSLPSKLW